MNKKNQKNQPQELSYYRLSLLAFLRESHPELADGTDFIASRGDSAAEAYSETVRSGLSHDVAAEVANEVLFANLHFSKLHTTRLSLFFGMSLRMKCRKAVRKHLPYNSFPFVKRCSPNIRYPMILLSIRSSTAFIRNLLEQS